MAKLVIGNNKTVGVPVITKEVEKLPALGLMKAKDANGKLVNSTTESQIIDFTGIVSITDNYLLYFAYKNNTAISGAVDMSDLTTLGGSSACNSMFYGCTGLTSVDMSSLTTITGANECQYMFQGCTGLTSVDLSSLITVSAGNACASMFQDCTGLTIVDLSSLTNLSGASSCISMFQGCTGLTSVDMSSLTAATGNNACASMFQGCTSLATVRIGNTTAIDFGTRTTQFANMFSNCTQNIDVYAPAANQSKIESFSGYPNFGGTGTVTWHWNTAE